MRRDYVIIDAADQLFR